jgi:tetratricopeptide (TPR) repeat protein
MNTQELLKQADYTFQRGNRELAKKYLTEFLAAHPNDEAAWMLMARIVDEKERKIECYERAIKINPGNNEAKIGLARIKSVSPTLPRGNEINNIWQAKPKPYKNTLRAALSIVVVVFLFATTTLVVARNNPESDLAKMLTVSTPDLYVESIADDIAPQTRAQVSASYPQYAPLVDTLINFAVENANNGMEGAPERPGAEIMISEKAGMEAKTTLEKALPQPGTLASVTITEQQATSWLALGMQNNPDLPLSDVQVYLRNGKIQVWGMVNGNETSTSALIIGTISIDNKKQPYFEIETLQVGQQVVPGFLVAQAESWLNQSLAAEIDSQVPGLELMNINVTNGLITISGMR